MDLKYLIIAIVVLANTVLVLVKFIADKNGKKKIVNNPNNPFPCRENTNLIKELKGDYKSLDDKIDKLNEFCAKFEVKFDSLEKNNERDHLSFTIKLNGLKNRR